MKLRTVVVGLLSPLLLTACIGSAFKAPPPRELTAEELQAADEYLAMQTPLPANWTFTDVPFEGQGNLRVGLATPEEPRATVLYVPGYTSSAEAASDLFAAWHERGIEVASLDLPGQGGSMRREDDYQKPYTGDYSFYGRSVDEAARYVLANRESSGPMIVAGNSFGGASTLRSMADGHLTEADGILLVVPGVRPQTGRAPFFLAKWVVGRGVRKGRGSEYFGPAGPWHPDAAENFDNANCGDRPDRHFKNKYLFMKYPELRVGGPTPEFLLGMVESGEALFDDPEIENFMTPVTTVTGGRDVLINNKYAHRLCEENLGNCEVVHIEDATHCFVFEDDETQRALGDALVDLIERAENSASTAL